MLKHVGYAVVDSEGDVFVVDYTFNRNDLEYSLDSALEEKSRMDIEWPESSPHKLVRLLIDDEAVNEQ